MGCLQYGKTFTYRRGPTGTCCDPGPSGARHQVQGCETTPGRGVRGHDVSSAQVTGSTASTTVWSLVSTVGGSAVAARAVALWCLQVQQLGTRAGSSCCWSWWCTYSQLWGPAAGACGVAGAGCRHSYSWGVGGRASLKGED